eukprot:jgi/Mesen1/5402/ME000268S04598
MAATCLVGSLATLASGTCVPRICGRPLDQPTSFSFSPALVSSGGVGQQHIKRGCSVQAAMSGEIQHDSSAVPRICTLREFSEQSDVIDVNQSGVADMAREMNVANLLAASVEASAQMNSFETFSGRLAMMGFATALSVECVTGNSVFSGIDVEGLGKILALCLLAAGGAAGFAFAWRSKNRAAGLLASGCQHFMDSAVDKAMEGLFFEETERQPWKEQN